LAGGSFEIRDVEEVLVDPEWPQLADELRRSVS
jgi:hypothetical protein